MPDIFISHSSADRSLAEHIVSRLEQRGASCWISYRDLPPGMSYPDALVRSIEDCAVFLLLFSGSANVSKNVAREVELAFAERKAIMPISIDGSKPTGGMKYWLNTSQFVSSAPSGVSEETLDQILLMRRTAAVPVKPEPETPSKLESSAHLDQLKRGLAKLGYHASLDEPDIYRSPRRPDMRVCLGPKAVRFERVKTNSKAPSELHKAFPLSPAGVLPALEKAATLLAYSRE